jgi:mRNA interferase MazF
MGKSIEPKRGDVYLVNFDSTIGSEIKKIRPALILQNDTANKYSPVTIVAAVTSFHGDKLYPTEVNVAAPTGALDQDSIVLLNQLRTIDKERLLKKLGMLDQETMAKVDTALLISVGLMI